MDVYKDPCLYLNRHGMRWHMDIDTFINFMKHVFRYYHISESIEKLNFEEIEHVEITEEDLYIASFIFGLYLPGCNQAVLVPVYPSSFNIPWANQFQIHLFKEKNNTATSHLLLLSHR
jgi:hypothetical protein